HFTPGLHRLSTHCCGLLFVHGIQYFRAASLGRISKLSEDFYERPDFLARRSKYRLLRLPLGAAPARVGPGLGASVEHQNAWYWHLSYALLPALACATRG